MRTEAELAQRHSRAVVPGQTSIIGNPRLLDELKEKRKYHGDIATAELRKDPPDYGIVNPNQALATLYHDAITTLEKLIDQNAKLTETLKNRVIVALDEAKEPVWAPTHRHYKGTLYRVTGVRWDADHEELAEMIEYDDADGTRFVISKRRWESTLDSGRQRYEYIYAGVPVDTSTTAKTAPTLSSIESVAKAKIKKTGLDRTVAFDQAAAAAGFANYEDAKARLGEGDHRA